MPPEPTPYDAVPYQSIAFPQTHPDRLAGIAALLGLRPPGLAAPRVLELGCAAGGNLIPMAEQFPDGTFVGLDLSARQVADGQQTITELELSNVELRQADISSIDEGFGTFDFVIAHGVFSWVPEAVQDHLLRVCRQNLNPDGVAYVSYNTYPGWATRGMIRTMMLFHAARFPDPAVRVREARGILDFLARAADPQTPYGAFLRAELETLQGTGDQYLFHEHLESDNHPILFADFCARAARHGLRFLAEAELPTMVPAHFPPDVQQVLQRVAGDAVGLEQYMDFLRNRTFRQTLLVPADRQPGYDLRPASLAGLYLAMAVRPARPDPDLEWAGAEMFLAESGLTVEVTEAIVKVAVAELGAAWPARVRFEELCGRARARLGGPPTEADAEAVGVGLLRLCTTGGPRLVEVATRPLPELTGRPGERPRISPLARRQAVRGEPVTTRRHETYRPGEFAREVLTHLDGKTDRPAIVRAALERVRAGSLTVQRDGQPVADPADAEPLLGQSLERVLEQFGRYSLLLGDAAGPVAP